MQSRLRRFTPIILMLALAGCASPQPSATPSPTEVAAQPSATAASTTAPTPPVRQAGHLILATTTSTQDSGLLDVILPDFQKKTGLTADVIAVGTGQAIDMGTRGDADVLLVHDRPKEDAFVKAGDGTQRYDVMYNDFIIVGPAGDPAGIKGMKDAVAAFKAIAAKQATFVSRGDKSGTNAKELAIWKQANITPSGDWYISAGQGMGEVLTMSEEQEAYTLSDRGTYLKRQSTGIKLEILVEGDKTLFNPYGVIPVSPHKHPGVNAEAAQKFVDWLISLETQQLIASYKINGQQLFYPSSDAWKAAHP